VALDEQIFAIQHYGGISRQFAELARQFVNDPLIGVNLLPLDAPIVNRYILDDAGLTKALNVHDAKSATRALAKYFTRFRPRTRTDVIHNTFYLPHGLAGYPGAKRVVTVHDMIPERMPKTRRRLDFLTMKHRYIKAADHIICVSDYTRQDMLDVLGPVRAPISVVYHGVDEQFRPTAQRLDALPDRYVIFVGNRGGYKNADVLFRAFGQLQDTEINLVLVGGGELTPVEHARLQQLKIASRVQQHWLPDASMASAYSNAELCVFPSQFEGFGLPALEAMACATPVVLALATSLPEVGGNAAEYFTPGDHQELAASIDRLLGDPQRRVQMSQAGLAHAKGFTWAACALATAAVYQASIQ